MKELGLTKMIILTACLLTGCSYDVEEELYPTIECQTADMSYANDIIPIMETDCYTCHSAAANFGNVNIEGYDQMIKYVDNGSLLGAVKHEPGYSPMPKNGAPLLDCEIEKIAAWIEQGALDN